MEHDLDNNKLLKEIPFSKYEEKLKAYMEAEKAYKKKQELCKTELKELKEMYKLLDDWFKTTLPEIRESTKGTPEFRNTMRLRTEKDEKRTETNLIIVDKEKEYDKIQFEIEQIQQKISIIQRRIYESQKNEEKELSDMYKKLSRLPLANPDTIGFVSNDDVEIVPSIDQNSQKIFTETLKKALKDPKFSIVFRTFLSMNFTKPYNFDATINGVNYNVIFEADNNNQSIYVNFQSKQLEFNCAGIGILGKYSIDLALIKNNHAKFSHLFAEAMQNKKFKSRFFEGVSEDYKCSIDIEGTPYLITLNLNPNKKNQFFVGFAKINNVEKL